MMTLFNDAAVQTRCLFSVQAMEATNSGLFHQLLVAALRYSSSFIKAHTSKSAFFFFFFFSFSFFFFLFMYLHYDTTMSTYSSNINFIPVTLAGAFAGVEAQDHT